MNTVKNYLSLVKFSHTVFALPFALLGFFIAVNMDPFSFDPITLALIILCMIFARSAAMAFNRYLDRDIDKLNERTSVREIPAGVLKEKSVLLFVILNSVGFIITTYFINSICFYLSPVALLVVLGYSFTKRFTALCHLVLGLGLALAPVGAYLAVSGQFNLIPILFGFIVLTWVAGFDIIYALQDVDFDTENNLKSIPQTFGKSGAMYISILLHTLTVLLLIYTSYLLMAQFPSLSWMTYLACFLFVVLVIYQHLIVSPKDLSRVNLAFFTTNGIASLLFGCLVIFDFYF